MEVIAARNGDFFIVKDNLAAETADKLSNMTFEEFELYSAWASLRNISSVTKEQFLLKHNLDINILDNFSSYYSQVYYKKTKDLRNFFEKDENYGRFRNTKCTIKKLKDFQNGFNNKIPKINLGFIYDCFCLKNENIPEYIKKIGTSIKRRITPHIILYNNITGSPHILPHQSATPIIFNQQNKIIVYENIYIFYPEDWYIIKQIRKCYKELKNKQKNSWITRLQNDNSILNSAIKKVCTSPQQISKYQALYNQYIQLSLQRTDYYTPFIYECQKLRNRIMIESRLCKTGSNRLLPEDIFNIMIENERSANLSIMFQNINNYWFDGDINKLFTSEPCLKILQNKNQTEIHSLLKNLDFLVSIKLQSWMKNSYSEYYNKILEQSLRLIELSPLSKDLDFKRTEYHLMRSMMYSLKVYDPDKKKYEIKKLDQHIKLPIPLNSKDKERLAKRQNNLIVRQNRVKEFLKIKHGFSDELIKKANTIYHKTLSRAN